MLAYQLEYNSKVIADGLSFNTEAAEFLDQEFKGCVTDALEDLLRQRPENPIPFLAKKIRENKREEVLLAEKILQEQKAAERASKTHSRRHRGSTTITNTVSALGSSLEEKSAVNDEGEGEEPPSPALKQTDDGYQLRLPGDLDCHVANMRYSPPHYIPGINVAKVSCPTLYDLDAVIRVMEASAVPNEDSGKPTPMALVLEQPTAPVQVVFNKGIPYQFNLIGPLQKEIRRGNADVRRPASNESFEGVALELLKAHWTDDIVLLEDAVKDFIKRKNDEESNIHLLVLPSVQKNYMETYDAIDSVFHEIMHPELTSCIRRGKHYSKTPSARSMPYAQPPSVLFVSYNPISSGLTFSRVMETFFPYYERLQNINMDKLREASKARKTELNLQFCEDYWAGVHARREQRDKEHKPGANKQAKFIKREREDAKFLEVTLKLKHSYAIRIQKLFRGYSVRRRLKQEGVINVVPRVTTHTLYDSPLPIAVPPLLRLCASRISKVHGELFGNYPSSLLPEPQRVIVHKPVRTIVQDSDDESEAEDWVEEVVYIPSKRLSKSPCHTNPLQRLLEYHRLAECSVLETAMKIQKQCGGLSLLQRKAYDYLKSLTLSLLHIAYLELFHRDRLPFDSMCFSSFMKNFHGEVCGWLSYPHLISQSCLLSLCRSSAATSNLPERKLRIVRDFAAITLKRERLLLLRSDVDYVNYNDSSSLEQFKAQLGIRTLGRNIYAIPHILSEVEWKAALAAIKETAVVKFSQISDDEEPTKLYWWFLPDSPCIYSYGRSFIFRARKNDEIIEGRERFDEFCPREVLKSDKECPSVSPKAAEPKEAEDMTPPPQPQQGNAAMSMLINDYSIFDAEEDIKNLLKGDLATTGKFIFLRTNANSSSFESRELHRAELDAEYLQQARNKMRDQKPKRVYRNDSDSDTESYISSHHSSVKDFDGSTDIAALGSVTGFSGAPNAEIRTVRETAEILSSEETGLRMEFMRPRMNFAAQDEYIARFDLFVESCLNQIKEEASIVLNFEDESFTFYSVVVTVLSRGYELANVGSLGEGSQLNNPMASFSNYGSQQCSSNVDRLSFLEDVYEILRSAMMQNGVDVNECVSTINSIISEFESYNILHSISSDIDKAETEPDAKKCRDHILSAVRHTERYVWLVMLQVYLALPFTKDSLVKTAINPTPSFSSFFKSVGVRKWIETIDPWKYRPHESPDACHARYSNSLRRWDSDNYICFGAIVEQDLD